jgi:uncharacterized integral membrane protein
MKSKHAFTREQKTVIVAGITCFILVLVICQIWLVTATVNAFLGGDDSIVWPAAVASLACLALNLGLLRYLYLMEKA